MEYLGEFTLEEIERIKRRACDSKLNEELGIKLTYVAPLKSLGKNDDLFQGFIFNYNNNDDTNENEDKKGRSR